ncbi:MAG TPA: helix-turn-helix transcriptional regulator [Steroidobacteraceae bacterium]
MGFPLPVPAKRAIARLGADISKARRRRRLSQASLAQRSGISVATLKRLENGEPRVAVEAVARVLQVLGEIDRLAQLLGTEEDQVGLALMDEQLPKRVRRRRSSGAL